MRGIICIDLDDYEAKQGAINTLLDSVHGPNYGARRYCGEIIDSVVIPDVKLIDGRPVIREATRLEWCETMEANGYVAQEIPDEDIYVPSE